MGTNMLKLFRNKYTKTFGFLLLLSGFIKTVSASPLADIDVSLNTTANYRAGASTNSVYIDNDDTVGGGGSAPDSGTRIDLILLDENGSEVSNALRTGGSYNTYFLTNNTRTTYGDGTESFTFYRAGTVRLRATSTTGVTDTSLPFNVSTGAANKLIIIAPGQSLLAGRDPSIVTTGRSGVADAPVVNSTFQIRVQLTDANFNPVSGTDSVQLTGGSFSTIVPSGTQSLVEGVATFTVSISAPKSAETYTVLSTGSLVSIDATVTSAGPESERVAAFPSPFNPHEEDVSFQCVVDADKNVSLKVIDQFGNKVWEKSDDGEANTLNIVTWNGKNDDGVVVAAGAYYVLLEVDGSLKSKKKFGVKK